MEMEAYPSEVLVFSGNSPVSSVGLGHLSGMEALDYSAGTDGMVLDSGESVP
jgi:hypothetical protein